MTDFVDNKLNIGSRRNMMLDSLDEAEHITDDLEISHGPLAHSKTTIGMFLWLKCLKRNAHIWYQTSSVAKKMRGQRKKLPI